MVFWAAGCVAVLSGLSAISASTSWSDGTMSGVAAVSAGRGAVTGRGRVSAPAAVTAPMGAGVVLVGGGFAAFAAALSFHDRALPLSLSCLSGAWIVQISIKNFMPKKLTPKKDRKAVAISGKNAASIIMLTNMNPMHAKPSPKAIIAIV